MVCRLTDHSIAINCRLNHFFPPSYHPSSDRFDIPLYLHYNKDLKAFSIHISVLIDTANCFFQMHQDSRLGTRYFHRALWFWTHPAKVLCVPFISSFASLSVSVAAPSLSLSRYTLAAKWLITGKAVASHNATHVPFVMEKSISDLYSQKPDTQIWDHRTLTPLNPRLHEEEKLLCSLPGFYSNPFIHHPHPQLSFSLHNIFCGQKVPK